MIIGLLRKYTVPSVREEVAAMVAKEHSATAIFFTTEGIRFSDRTISGLVYEKAEWKSAVLPFPDVVYNDIPTRLQKPLYEQLEQEGIPFTTHRLGRNKIQLHRKMEDNPVIQPYLIPTAPFRSTEQFLVFLEEHKEIMVKPNRGHKGEGIYLVQQHSNERYSVTDHAGQKSDLSRDGIVTWLLALPHCAYHHFQPVIRSVTRDNTPYVIRSYVRKNGKGQWVTLFHYAALALNGNKIVNVSKGSGFSYIRPFLKNQFGEQAESYLQTLSSSAQLISKQVQTFVPKPVDALGIDFGLTQEGKLVIFEVNAFPGTRPFEALVEKHAIPYALYLGKTVTT